MTLYFGLKMKTKILKNKKPIELDVHCKYICDICDTKHWLSLLETQTKNYRLVCSCGSIIRPKRIKTVKVLYAKKKNSSKKSTAVNAVNSNTISSDLLNKAVATLSTYGYDRTEAAELAEKCFQLDPTQNFGKLIKSILVHIGSEIKNGQSS